MGCRDLSFKPGHLFMARRKMKRYRAKRQLQLQTQMQVSNPHPPTTATCPAAHPLPPLRT
ncbi:protein jim lovell [Drosophila madeirensis]|uniref:Protein jim lovell n=1 Tax=Drosophila madeirensis TaxID=30013 RepID=A0AAU9GEI9_DROMD